jgi:His-Xaa-Ser system protein HxsD
VKSGADGLWCDIDSDCSATVRLDPRIYTKQAVLKAMYWCTEVAYIHCPISSDERIEIHVQLKESRPTLKNPKPVAIDQFVRELCNALLDFELRSQIESETSPIRELILAKAFSESGVLEDSPPGSIADPIEAKKPSSLVQILNDSNADKK